MHFEFGPYLIIAIVLLLQYAASSRAFHPFVRILFLWIATWNTHIRLQPKMITPEGYAAPNLDYPSRKVWKLLGMFCAFGMVYIAGMIYVPSLSSTQGFSKMAQGLLCLTTMLGGTGYVLHFYNN